MSAMYTHTSINNKMIKNSRSCWCTTNCDFDKKMFSLKRKVKSEINELQKQPIVT